MNDTRPIGYLFAAGGFMLALASAFVSLTEWQPFAIAPPLAGILESLAIVVLVGLVLVNGVRSDFINFATLLAFIALGRLLLVADEEIARILLALAHIAGLAFYARHQRRNPTLSQWTLGVALVVLSPLIVWLSTTEMLVALYASALGAMAAASWMSRFPRLLAGFGVLAYAGSDIVLLAGRSSAFMTPMLREALEILLFIGLLAASIGVIRIFRREGLARL